MIQICPFVFWCFGFCLVIFFLSYVSLFSGRIVHTSSGTSKRVRGMVVIHTASTPTMPLKKIHTRFNVTHGTQHCTLTRLCRKYNERTLLLHCFRLFGSMELAKRYANLIWFLFYFFACDCRLVVSRSVC